MKTRELFIPAHKISAVDSPEIIEPVEVGTETKARIIDLFLKKSLGLKASSLYFSNITTSLEFAGVLVTQYVESYRNQPLQATEHFMAALMEVLHDESISKKNRNEFLRVALESYHDLIVRLDRLAFPPFDMVYEGIPEYLPDGLSDMGHFAETNPLQREREKIRIRKLEVFQDHQEFLLDILWLLHERKLEPQSVAWQKVVFYKVLEYVHDEMPYDYTFSEAIPKDRSVSLMEFRKDKLKALCRHQALLVQVLLQTLGVNSRLYRCNAFNMTAKRGGRHVANIAQIGIQWFLGDATSPEPDLLSEDEKFPFIRTVPGSLEEIPDTMQFSRTDLVKKSTIRSDVRYETIDHMRYRIRDNAKDELG